MEQLKTWLKSLRLKKTGRSYSEKMENFKGPSMFLSCGALSKEEMSAVNWGLEYCCLVGALGVGMAWVSLKMGEKGRKSSDKKVAFECGFDPLSNPRAPFSLPFFLVGLMFIIFDVEVVLVLGICSSVKVGFVKISALGAFLGVVFCGGLFLGLVHEINEGSLEWR